MIRPVAVQPRPVPLHAGIGLRAPHVRGLLAERPRIAWIEVHSENLLAEGGPFRDAVARLRRDYPLSLHGVGLSLGSAGRLSATHLRRLRQLVRTYQPGLVSEHLSWSAIGRRHSNELLPLPFTEEALRLVAAHIGEIQDTLGRQILVENVSTYLRFKDGDYTEWDFVAEVVRRSGCGLLCDVNNIYVNGVNHGFDPHAYLRALPAAAVREIHLAGFTRRDDLPVPVLIDSHSRRVSPQVWDLYAEAVGLFGPTPTLIEWDMDIPRLKVLLDEASHAEEVLNGCRSLAA